MNTKKDKTEHISNNTYSKQSQENVNKKNNSNSNYELFEKLELDNTPFTVISDNEKKIHFGVMGMYRITHDKEDVNEVVKELEEITWNRIMQVILILTEINKKQ